MRPAFLFCLSVSLAGAQVRQGGVYQITGETLNSGGGSTAGGNYALQHTLPVLGGSATGGTYSILSGFTGQLGSSGTGSGPAAFLAWQTAVFGGPGVPGAGAQEDPDQDGIPNLLEFAFNLPPESPGTPLALTGATGGLPWIREEEIGGQPYFTMEYIRRKNAGEFVPQSSRTLTSWGPSTFTVLSGPVSISGAYERIKLQLGSPIQPGEKIFHRLQAVIQ